MIRKVIRYILLALVVVGIVFALSTLTDDKGEFGKSRDKDGYTVSIKVMDMETRKFLADGVFILKSSDGKVIEEWTLKENVKRITNLKNGSYVIVQKSAKDGYEISEPVMFKIYNEGKDVTIYNEVIIEEIIETEEVNVDNTLSLKNNFVYVVAGILIGIGILLVNKRKIYFE